MTNSYGYDEGWCWLKSDKYQLLWRIGSFYGIVILVVIFNVWSYYKIISEIRYEISLLANSAHQISDKNILFNRFSLYPAVLTICYLPVLCKRAYEYANDGQEILWLSILAGSLTSLIGIFNAILYGLTNNIKDTILGSCRSRSQSAYDELILNEDDQRNRTNLSD